MVRINGIPHVAIKLPPLIIAVLMTAGIFVMICQPAFAIDNPDSTPTISDVYANINLVENGDVLIYGEVNIPYASLPDDDASETYIIRLISTNGTAQLGTTLIYPGSAMDSGYNLQAFGFYFSASDNLTTDQLYIIRISQNPAYFDSPQSYDYTMELSSWTDATSQDSNQTELTLNIINIAEDLEAYHDETLLESSVGGTVLSDPGGETYFRGAIYGIQAMAPSLFLVQSLTWDTTDRTWTTTQFDTYGNRFSGTFIGTASDNVSGAFGLSTPTFMGFIFGLPVMAGMIIVSNIKFRHSEPGFIFVFLFLILLALMGWIDKALFAIAFQCVVLYIGYLWFYSRTGDSFSSKMFSFFAFVWILSTMVCLILEGAWFGTTEGTIINDLSAFTSLRIGGMVPIPAPNLYFFRGVFRMLLWDYSFYTGMFEIVRYIWLAVFTGGAVWGLAEKFAPVFANFLRIR